MSNKRPVRKNRYKKRKQNVRSRKKGTRRNRLGIILISTGVLSALTLLSLGLIFIHDLITQCDYFGADRIEVSGNERLNKREILSVAGIRPGENILSINLALARKQLLAHPWVADAEISRELPKGIVVRIREHKALAILDLGKAFLINRKGDIFKKHDASDPADLPVVRGLDYSDLEQQGQVKTPLKWAVEWLLMRQAMKKWLPEIEVREITVDREFGLTLLLQEGRRSICFGYSDYRLKTNRLRRIVKYLQSRSLLETIQSINLMNPDRVVLKPVG